MFAEVVLAKASKFTDKIYHYSIPAELQPQVGHKVLVPFGKRKEEGYVVGFVEKADVPDVKEIYEIIGEQPLFNEKQAGLVKWMAEYYCAFLGTALKLILPSPANTKTLPPLPKGEGGNVKGERVRVLTPDQQKVLEKITKAIETKQSEVFLLHGITGSGKTEVYLQAAAKVLGMGRSALILVPEISLAPQIVERFKDRFGDIVAVLHSDLTLKQRREAGQRIKNGEARIVVGTRLSIFAPIDNLGLIVVDEEFETTYKSEQSPRYHAREAAIQLAKLHHAVVVLGTATPSIESYYKAKTGEYQLLVLPERIDNRPLPPVEIVDMRQDKSYLLSAKLREELYDTLSKGEQAILFINRLGYFTFLICQDCGQTIQCPRCAVSLNYDTSKKLLRCTHCGFSCEAKIICSNCRGSNIKFIGTGTQRIEKETADVFPQAKILRWDRDATAKRGSHDVFFAAFAEGKANVLIGTQMVTKGLDVANVTLIGVISADTALKIPDFRAAERTFQLLTQVAGRAGRHHLPGKVIIQTYDPANYAIKAAVTQNYEAFYEKEIQERRELGYPPFSKLINLILSGKDDSDTFKIASDLKGVLSRNVQGQILGPAPAAVAKVRGKWRYHILLKGQDIDEMRRKTLEAVEKVFSPREVKIVVDIDPI
ncbi:MAG: primosomal protein N' [Candidatus Margulisbacteria bacterium]|nr:primosomal protein N' [Candidatus Margulisiibacteriota bacterium]